MRIFFVKSQDQIYKTGKFISFLLFETSHTPKLTQQIIPLNLNQ